MLTRITGLALFGSLFLAPLRASAQTAVLLSVADPTQLSELQLAKVMADDSSVWLSVRLQGGTRLALVAPETAIEPAPAADDWLRALDFATRVRVAAPPGPLAGCASSTPFELADSGSPESGRIPAREVSGASSELELRRLLQAAGLPVDVSRIAQFTNDAPPPFQVVIYDVPAGGGSTDALRLIDRGHPAELPRIELSGAKTLPISLIALAKDGVLPLVQESADPSEFPVAYRAHDGSSDYLSARGGWLAQNPTRWLNEVQASAALFAGTVLPAGEALAPVVSRYFRELSGATGSCEAQVQAARARASLNAADFACGGADDLAQSLSEVDFADLRVSRFFGMASAEGMKFRVLPGVPRSPFLLATDFDQSGCSVEVPLPASAPSDPPGSTSPPNANTPSVVGAPDAPYYYPTPVSVSESSSTVTVINSNSNDSCSGDSSSSDSSRDSCSGDSSSSDSSGDSCSGDSSSDDSSGDSCSGDSSSDDSSGDSCSGDSSSDDSEPDSCSGDSSDSSSDGCNGDSSSDSSSDGDSCSSNSAPANSAKKSAALRSGRTLAHQPRRVRLSLLTLLAAALALPLRRLRASR